MRILMLNRDTSAITHYRLRMPLLELARNGHEVRLPDRAPDGSSGLPSDEDLDWAELIVGRQLANPIVMAHWDRWAAFAPRVYETDDDLFAVDVSNPALGSYLNPGVTDAMRYMLATAELVTTSTETLAERMRSEGGAERVVVLPNRIDRSAFDTPPVFELKKPGDPFTVGWAGSTSHVRDWLTNARAIRAWLLDHPEVDFHIMGVDYLKTLEVPGRFTDWADPDKYLTLLDFSVGLCPLAPTQFNRCKSPIKAIEYGTRGIPVIASAETAYDDYVQSGYNGLLVEERSDWMVHLTYLLEEPTALREMGEAALAEARKQTIQDHWWRWEAAYQGVLDRSAN